MSTSKTYLFSLLLLFVSSSLLAQEIIVPVLDNAYLNGNNVYPKQKKRASLPFLDDFSYKASLPNPALWEEGEVYINNTMGIDVPTQGVATFDGLNEQGRPYNPNNF